VREGDLGVGGQTGDPRTNNQFKPASLRNIALTAPYMHDGRFATLEEVIDHYAAGGKHADAIGTIDSQIHPLDLTAEEKRDLVEFLNGLTDQAFTTSSSCRSTRERPQPDRAP
jgi:cytochrome c peroxidase